MDHLFLHSHPSVVTIARHFVADWCATHHLPADVIDTVELLTSELVGNAVVHGRGDVVVSINDGGDPSPRDGAQPSPQTPARPAATPARAQAHLPPVTNEHPVGDFTHGSPAELEQTAAVARADSAVLICVCDASPTRPAPRPLSDEAVGGRGLQLVDLLATAWGVTPTQEEGACHPPPPLLGAGLGGYTGGKTAWFLLNPSTPPG